MSGRQTKIYGIWRLDDDKFRTHCWVVRIQRRHRVWRRYFSDGSCGGKANALRAARAFRDELLHAHPPMTRAEYAAIRRKNNRSGFPGVCRHVAAVVRSGKPVERTYWIAFWMTPDGKSVRRKLSVDRYGEKGAYRRAKAIREQGLAALNKPFVGSPGLKNWVRRHGIIRRHAAVPAHNRRSRLHAG
jgi:hypothetical protein